MSNNKIAPARMAEWIMPAVLLTSRSAVFVLLEVPKYSVSSWRSCFFRCGWRLPSQWPLCSST
jgi:hypothetical protein